MGVQGATSPSVSSQAHSSIPECYVETARAAEDEATRIVTFADYLFTEMLKQWDTENS